MIDISVVIPVFNEAAALPLLYDRLKDVLELFGRDSELIFVDDGSTDNSQVILVRLLTMDNRVRLLKMGLNLGQCEAMQRGAEAAKNNTVVTIDADLQTDPSDIPRLVNRLNENFDIVCGWRHPRKDPWHKIVKSRIGNYFQRRITGLDLHDLGCALRAYRKDVLSKIYLNARYSVPFIPIAATRYTDRITEIKIRHYPRTFGKSKYGFWSTSLWTIVEYIELVRGLNWKQKK